MSYYETIWRNKFIDVDKADSIDDYIDALRHAANILEEWKKDGIQIVDGSVDLNSDYVTFYTEDEKIAEKHGFILNDDYEDIEFDEVDRVKVEKIFEEMKRLNKNES